MVARNARLIFFKDQKASKTQPEQTFRGELPLILDGASVDVASDYKKRKYVFRIKYVAHRFDFNFFLHYTDEMLTLFFIGQICKWRRIPATGS